MNKQSSKVKMHRGMLELLIDQRKLFSVKFHNRKRNTKNIKVCEKKISCWFIREWLFLSLQWLLDNNNIVWHGTSVC